MEVCMLVSTPYNMFYSQLCICIDVKRIKRNMNVTYVTKYDKCIKTCSHSWMQVQEDITLKKHNQEITLCRTVYYSTCQLG